MKLLKVKEGETADMKKIINHSMANVKIFKPNKAFIKKRVNNLIERGYIKRDDKDNTKFHYLP